MLWQVAYWQARVFNGIHSLFTAPRAVKRLWARHARLPVQRKAMEFILSTYIEHLHCSILYTYPRTFVSKRIREGESPKIIIVAICSSHSLWPRKSPPAVDPGRPSTQDLLPRSLPRRLPAHEEPSGRPPDRRACGGARAGTSDAAGSPWSPGRRGGGLGLRRARPGPPWLLLHDQGLHLKKP